MARVQKQTSASIDITKIIGDRRVYSFTDVDETELKTIISECKTVKVKVLTKSQRKNLKNRLNKKEEKKEEKKIGNTSISDIIGEVTTAFLGTETTVKETTPGGWNLPTNENSALIWESDKILPPHIDKMCNIFQQLFNSIKADDIKSKSVMLFPPASIISENITVVPRAVHGCMIRIIACLGSCEMLTFEVHQGKTDVSTDFYVSKDQAVTLGYGGCSAVEFTFNDSASFTSKLTANARGVKKNKSPLHRWILVIDYVSNENAITREFKNAIKKQSKGDGKLQKSLEDKINSLQGDILQAASEATNNAKLRENSS